MYRRAFCFLLVLGLPACRKTAPPDPICSYEPAPEATALKDGQGLVLISAPDTAYFYIIDTSAKQVGAERVNQALGVKAGEYRAKLNNSVHTVFVEEKKLTRCKAGAVNVSGTTGEYYYVLDAAGTQLAAAKVSEAIGLFPAKYNLKLNNSRTTAEVKPDAVTTMASVLLQVAGTTEEYYYVLDTAGAQLGAAKLATPMALFAGPVTLKVNNTTMPLDLKTGQPAEFKSATLVVAGETPEYYYVLNAAGTQLTSAKLSAPSALLEGSYVVKVNNSRAETKVTAGETTTIKAGALVVKSSAAEYYYVLDTAGTQLGSSKVNEPMSFVAGTYTVKLGSATKPVTVAEGQTAAITF